MAEKRKTSKRQRLEDAAAQLFWTKGYSATSIADLAKASDVPLGNVYYYFKSKAALALAVADLYVAGSQAAIDTIDENSPPVSNGAEARVNAFFSMLENSHMSRARSGCPIARAVSDFHGAAPEASARASEALTLLAGFLGRELARGGHANGMTAAQETIALWQGAIVLAHGSNDPQILMRIVEEQRQKLLRALPA